VDLSVQRQAKLTTMAITSRRLEVCGRCSGKGEVTIRLGPPGTEPHTPAGSIAFVDVGTYSCGACLGTGKRMVTVPVTPDHQLDFGAIWDAQTEALVHTNNQEIEEPS
jgi:hypothetical protein